MWPEIKTLGVSQDPSSLPHKCSVHALPPSPGHELSPSLSLIYQNLLMGTLLATGLVFRRPVKWQKQAPRGQLTFEQKDDFPDYLSPKARGCGQAQPTSGTPETPARPESHPEPSWNYPAWQGEIFVCPSRTPRGQGLSLLHLCFPHSHLTPVQCRVWPTVCAQGGLIRDLGIIA